MHNRFLAGAAGTTLLLGAFACVGFAQQQGVAGKVAEKFGQGLDNVGRGIVRGSQEVGDAFRKQFETMRGEVNRMNTASRVYSRIHWDRSLNSSKVEVHTTRGGAVLLRGMVVDKAARERAVTIARETMDVNEVIDELLVLASSVESTPAPIETPRAR